jgi:hypothetical protein
MTDAKDVTQVLGSDSNFLGPLFAAEQPLTPVMSDG